MFCMGIEPNTVTLAAHACRRLIKKVVEDYNQNMGGVDKSELVCIIHLQIIYVHTSLLSSTIFLINVGDQMIMYYGFSHRSVKWWKRVFFHLLDVALDRGSGCL